MAVILVTGGAGYIGAHTCMRLAAAGHKPVVFDNFENGHAEFVKWGPSAVGDIRDPDALARAFRDHRPEGVMHFAGLILGEESMERPRLYHDVNVEGTRTLVDIMERFKVERLVFSSSCAVYGRPSKVPLDESAAFAPISPYGETKADAERLLRDRDAPGTIRSVSLRYFNAAGADPGAVLGEDHQPETHAIPLAIAAARGLSSNPFLLRGTDYPTGDGTAIRDYVHVCDLAEAHLLAWQFLAEGGPTEAFNVGTGTGISVQQLLEEVGDIVGTPVPVQTMGRRRSDAPALFASAQKARATLGWTPQASTLRSIVETATVWHRKRFPAG